MSKVNNLAVKFSMKLGLETRQSVAEPTSDYIDVGSEDLEENDPTKTKIPLHSEDDPAYERLNYFGGELRPIKYYSYMVRLNMTELNDKLSLRDFKGMLNSLDQAKDNIDTLKVFIKEQMQKDAEKAKDLNSIKQIANKLAQTYMFEPEEYEPTNEKNDLGKHLNDYIDELDMLNYNELYNERKKLKAEIDEFLMDEFNVPYILKKKMEEVEKRMKWNKSLDADKPKFILGDLGDK